jgi:hypothetical protein
MHKRTSALAASILAAGSIAAPLAIADNGNGNGSDNGGKGGNTPAKTKTMNFESLSRSIPVTGTGDAGNAFAGKFKLKSFSAQDGKLMATGRLIGTLTSANGTQAVNQTVTIPASLTGSATGAKAAQVTSCRILTLVLGPLDLNLLGLRIQLNRINLRITGERGPGNLLGNLLCAIAGLLNPPTVAAPARTS